MEKYHVKLIQIIQLLYLENNSFSDLKIRNIENVNLDKNLQFSNLALILYNRNLALISYSPNLSLIAYFKDKKLSLIMWKPCYKELLCVSLSIVYLTQKKRTNDPWNWPLIISETQIKFKSLISCFSFKRTPAWIKEFHVSLNKIFSKEN